MKKNIPAIDRIIRLLAIVAVARLYFTHVTGSTLAIISTIIAVIPAVTAFTGFCPLYHIRGITTSKKPSQHNNDTRNRSPVDGQNAVQCFGKRAYSYYGRA